MVKYLALAVAFTAMPMFAQEVTGNIGGVVTDPSGAAIVGAKITVRNEDRGMDIRVLSTDATGGYVATLLPIGQYSVKAENPGFKTALRTGIELHVSDKLTVNFDLAVGATTDSVTVEETVVAVELQSPVAAGLISGTEVRELSLNNRNYIQLISLMPGVTNNSATDEIYIGTTNPLGSTNTIPFSINGGRTSANVYMIDGADNVDRGSNLTLMNYPSVEAISEFKAQRGLYSAEFGRGASGQINVMTRSGGAKYHGSLYEFNRNDKLAANNFYNNSRGIKRAPLRYNNFGYSFSGPVPVLSRSDRFKTFFFWSQEFRRVITYNTILGTVPTDDMKKGIFSSPVCIQRNGTTCLQTASQITAINPVAAAYIKDIYSQVPSGDPGTYSLVSSMRSTYNHRQELIKLDQQLGPKNYVSFRYLHDTIPTFEPGGLFTGLAIPGVAQTRTDSPGSNYTIRWTSTLRPTLYNEAGFSYSYGAIVSRIEGLISSSLSPDVKTTLAYPSTLARIPSVTFQNGSSITGYGPYDDYNRNYNMYDNVSWIRGRHTIKTGISVNLYQKTENNAGNNAGTFGFTGTNRPGTTTALFAQAWANFLLGDAATFTQAQYDLTPDIRQRQWEAYVQDDIRLLRNLTLNVGVRYSQFRSPYDATGFLTNFDATRFDLSKAPKIDRATGNIIAGTGDTTNGMIVNGSNSPYGQKVTNEDLWKFAPRFGLAWDPEGKGRMAIRTGYGISYDSTLVGIYEQNIFTNPPYNNNVSISNTRLENALASVPSVSAAPKVLRGTPSQNMIPYTQQWSFDLQRQFGKGTIVSAGYYGAKGTHLLGIVDMNQIRQGAAVEAGIMNPNTPLTSANSAPLNYIRPFQGYNAINQIQNWFNSNYHSLQTQVQHSFGTAGSIRGSYTWSKSLTDNSSDRSNAPQYTYNRSLEYARATFDRTHVATISYSYVIPVFKSSKGLLHAAFGGWQLSGIVSLQTGLPLGVTSGTGKDYGGIGIIGSSAASPRPDLVGNPNANAPHTLAQWFNTAAYAEVPAGTVRPGNASPRMMIGPGTSRLDTSIFKNFTIREGIKLQVRGESFNTLNHTNFIGVGTSFGSTTFGTVTSAREPRRIQLGARMTF